MGWEGSAPASWHREVEAGPSMGAVEKRGRRRGRAPGEAAERQRGSENEQWGGPLHSSRALAHGSQWWESASLPPPLAFPFLFLSPSSWAGRPETFTTSHCLQTPGVRKSCPPCASLMTSHPHTPPAAGDIRAVPRAGGLTPLLAQQQQEEGREAGVAGGAGTGSQVPAEAPSGWEARGGRQGQPLVGVPGLGLVWVPACVG